MSEVINQAISGISRFAAIHTMAELGCADHLAEGPLGVDELALRCGAQPVALGRVLRQLAALGLVRTVDPGVYALTEDGAALRSDVPGSLRSSIRMVGEESFWYALGNLPSTVRRGRPAMVERFGPVYQYLAANPETGRLFDDYMTSRSAPFIEAATAYDFSGVRTLVDVGGGKGHNLAAIMTVNPELRGILFDQEHVTPGARTALAELGDRCDVVSGDFFAQVPAGGDAYLLASVIHNWDDDDAVRILTNVRTALAPGGRVLLLELVIPEDDEPHFAKDIDMRMLALLAGGTERTAAEYAALLEKAGLRMTGVVTVPGGASVIEARPV
ncbi:acetylserotonin O-methyltransferase [Microbispora oryzae]|nr:acetylserotonin O-methyltransferase [Microbispora oryzae]